MTLARRSFLTGLLVLSAAPVIPAAAAPSGVSPRMSELISEFVRCTDALDATDHDTDPLGWDRAADIRCRALEALLDERPSTMADYAAKISALVGFIEEDADGHSIVLNTLVEDAQLLAEVA